MRKILNSLGKAIILSSIFIMGTSISINAHNGGSENEDGGHDDIFNISKLGKYHYHHGYEAHKHDGGVCPELEAEGKEDGKVDGREAGYSGLTNLEYTYGTNNSNLQVYKTSYIPAYEKSYNEAFRSASKELDLVTDNGYKMGLQGEIKNTNDYEHQLLKTAYETSYEKGYNEYKKQEEKEYEENGRKHGYEGTSKINFENLLDEYKRAYENGYTDGVEKRRTEKIIEGKNAAINNTPINESYQADNKEWYEEGFKQGQLLLKEIKTEASNQGKSGKEKSIPENLQPYEDIFNKFYEEGVKERETEEALNAETEKRKQTIKITLICITTVIIIVPTILLIKNKLNKKNNLDEDNDIVA